MRRQLVHWFGLLGPISLISYTAAALITMFIGAAATGLVPEEYFGLFERFSVFAVTAFNAVLGCYLFNGFGERMEKALEA